MAKTEKIDVSKSLKDLEKIVEWFENQSDLDIEEGLKRVKLGAEIIKQLKSRLKEVENEFNEIKKDLED